MSDLNCGIFRTACAPDVIWFEALFVRSILITPSATAIISPQFCNANSAATPTVHQLISTGQVTSTSVAEV